MEFKTVLKEKIDYIETLLNEYMPKEEGYQQTIMKAMNYSLKAGGKRLRPILTLESCKIVGGKEEDAIPFAMAIEMIHTYSLIHDDLPALDNDDLRRGKPTNHKVFGDGMATLAGDALLNYAFEVMLSSSINKKGSNKYLKAINEIAKHAGIYGMIGGQVVDVESENKIIDKDKLDFIHLNKTAAMIVGCMRAGAIIGGATEEELEKVTKYGKNIGLSFQIVDDILDITGDEEKLGKPIGSDIENHKSTYPSLLGLEKSREIARQLIEEGKSSIDGLSSEIDFLNQLGDYIISRDC
ncbi:MULTISPECIES: polyprenyl synthetase family protein [Terrisporobacter]|uniref:Farnesyl diphosphate synthase n=2 Tax=Terrisporobacter TaxID=1505652 RepID=A0A0B3VXC4_9FIRM|nr:MULTISPECIES: farnesyl diphosphate synthase [Terrisporobacter]KHS57229.1 farnesyl-diphosphate synthase [Terrisporobacter othiniensis]MCC3668296.1 polyprenyl synthetase family protein [Terrisporobacter mayombei]MCR1822484.1 polyprenyl synthetase family protein [Terrisporobacter muris]MDY3375561.1 farnesyl diphosphate synthase [Terrisporobacter othiniensis]